MGRGGKWLNSVKECKSVTVDFKNSHSEYALNFVKFNISFEFIFNNFFRKFKLFKKKLFFFSYCATLSVAKLLLIY